MNWIWGDGGANYTRIEKEDLKAERFERLRWWSETS